MSARVVDVAENLVTIRVVGQLQHTELKEVQSAVGELIHDKNMIRVLVLAEDFEGWAKGGDWGDVSFQAQFDGHIEKMAIVGEQQWEDLTLLFTAKGVRRFPIEFFSPRDIRKAREWLAETA